MIPDFVFPLKDGKNRLEPKAMTPNDLVFAWPKFRSNFILYCTYTSIVS